MPLRKFLSTENGIALGQLAIEEKSNEITAIPELLDSIEIEGAVVSHGRVERREYYQATIPDGLTVADRWRGAKTMGMIIRTHDKGDGVLRREVRYSISSERRNIDSFAR